MFKSSIIPQRTVWFWGNSLMNYGTGNLINVGRLPNTCYSTIVASKVASMQNISVGGKQTNQMITDFPTVLEPYIKKNDIVVIWELINDMGTGGGGGFQTNAQAYANYQTCCSLVRGAGGKAIVCSTIPNLNATYEANYTIVDGWIRSDWATFADGYVDFRTVTGFQTVADSSNLTNYNSDRIHLTTVGYDTLAPYVATQVLTLLY